MYNKLNYAIYCSDEDYGYVSGVSYFEDANLLITTRLKPEAYFKDEVPRNAYEIAEIKTFSYKQAAQGALEEFAQCKNVSHEENLFVRELTDQEIEFIERCRIATIAQKKAQAYVRQFQKKKLRCLNCGNNTLSEMIIGEMTYQLMDNRRQIKERDRFKKKISVYCHKCAKQIV